MTRADEVLKLAEQIKPILAGKDQGIQAAVLAELLSLFLAGHWIPGEPEETLRLRAEILAQHCIAVRRLTEFNATEIGTDQ